jgi:hypothetical protein
MPNVKNSYPIFEHPVKNLVGISNERNDVHAFPFDDPLCGFGVLGDAGDNPADACFERDGDRVTENEAVAGSFAQVGYRTVRILDLHARRNVRKAASTCSWLATPLRSASSIACNSSAVA